MGIWKQRDKKEIKKGRMNKRCKEKKNEKERWKGRKPAIYCVMCS
jgi:hypothetical protein